MDITDLGTEDICELISKDVVCGFAPVSTTTNNLQWASLSTRPSSSPVQLPPSTAKSLTRSSKSSASGLVFGDRQRLITVASNGDTGSTFTTQPSSTVFSSSTNESSLSSESSKASKQEDPFQSSENLISSEILLATSRNSPNVSSTNNETLFATIATFRPSYSHSSSHNDSTVSSQSCTLCTKSFCPRAACSYSSSRAPMRVNSGLASSVGPTTSTLLRSSVSPGPTVSVSSTPTVAGFYELVQAGVTSYIGITATITSPPPGFTTVLASNTHWTGDTTTVSDGTTYPVIYGCAHCGGRHHGIVIEGLGGKPNDPKRPGCGSGIFRSIFGCGTQFNFPPLWGLPPFIIDPLGDPMTSAPDPDPDEEPTGNPRSNGPSLSQASSTPTISTSASSTAACSPTSTPNLYAIFLVDGVTDTEVESLSTYLQEEVGGPDVVAAISASMFAALIDDCVASKIDSHPSVSLP